MCHKKILIFIFSGVTIKEKREGVAVLGVFNGVFKGEIIVDVVQIDPDEYDLEKNYIWFDVGVSVGEVDIALSAFHFYLADSNKKMINPVSMVDSSDYDKSKIDYGVFVGFDFKPDFFYSVPTFGFYCDTYKRVELIELSC